jgi:hypothetical protein
VNMQVEHRIILVEKKENCNDSSSRVSEVGVIINR